VAAVLPLLGPRGHPGRAGQGRPRPLRPVRGQGALETTPGDYVDQNFVKKALVEGFADFDVQAVGFDPWNARKLSPTWRSRGVPIERVR
jgi:phage terminase large subunit-like protein